VATVVPILINFIVLVSIGFDASKGCLRCLSNNLLMPSLEASL